MSFVSYAQKPKVDIIFVMDTSGSMDDEGSSLHTALTQMQTDLQQTYDLKSQVWAITEQGYDGYPYSSSSSPFNWITTSVEKEIPNATVDWDEDWGPAVYDIATKYTGWRTGAVKIVVPISDEGPQNGDPVDQDDRDIITQASQAAQSAGIYVLPVVGSGASQVVDDLANVLGGGTYFSTTEGTFTPQKMKESINKILATATGQLVFPPTNMTYQLLPYGAKVYWQGAEGASYYKYDIYVDNTLIANQETTTQPFISIPSQGKNCNIKVQVSACNNNANPKCSNPTEITFNLSANNIQQIISNSSKTKEVLKTTDTTQDDYLNKNVSKTPGMIAEPVDVATGNFAYSHIDMVIPAPGIPFIVERFYNSIDYKKGWYFSFQNSLDLTNTNAIKVFWGKEGRGGVNIFQKAARGDYVAQYGADKLYIQSGNYIIEKPSGVRYVFDINGKEIAIKNKQGLGLQFEYPDANTIIVKDTLGNTLATISLVNNQIQTIEDPVGNTLSYTYDNDGNIVSYTDRDGQTTTYEYDENGYLTEIIGPDNSIYLENTYDDKGRVTEQKDGSGHTTTFSYTFNQTNPDVIDSVIVTYPNNVSVTYNVSLDFVKTQSLGDVSLEYGYDINNKINSFKDPYGKQWKFVRNDAGLITKAIDPSGNEYTYSYDANNNLIGIKDPIGHQIQFEYDVNNNLVKIIYPDNSTTNIEYNSNNFPIKVIDNAGNIFQYAYNQRGLISTITLPNGGQIKYTYDQIGNVISVVDPLGNNTAYTYDKNGELIKITNALGKETKFEYDAYGELIKLTDPKGRSIQAQYNTDGLLTKLTLPDNSTIEYTYDALGRVIETKDPLCRITKREYDDFGRLKEIIDPKGNTFEFIYDKVGNLIDITDSKGNSVKIEYDNLYRPSKSYNAYGNLVSQINYNPIGQPTKITDAVGKTLDFVYDALNRLKQSTLSGSITAKAQYDSLGRIIKLIDPKGYETDYEYDVMGNLVKETNPLGNSWKYSYDLDGRLVKSQFPNGVIATYYYDALNRLTKLCFQKDTDSKSISYSYDEVGNLLSIEDDVGKITYSYDINDRIIQRKDVFGNIVKYKYDNAGRLVKLIYPDGKAVNYAYDDNNNLVQIKDFKGNITEFEYDKNNNLIKTTYPNGYYTLYTYDNNNKIISIKNYNSNGKLITGDELSRDKMGNIISIKKVEYVKPILSNLKPENFTVNEFNQITSSDEGNFIYDKNGNLLSYTYNGKQITLKYDLADRLIEADVGPDTYTYKYDAEGNRIEVTKNGQTTRYVIDNVMGLSKPIAETDSSNNIQRYYIWGNGLVYAIDANGRLYIYLYNYRGDTSAIVDDTGKILAAYTYSAYGKVLGEYGEQDNPFKFLGRYGVMADSDNLYYIRARYYSQDLGRFVQPDLINLKVPLPIFLNRYKYAIENPLNYVDLNGEFVNLLIGAGVGALIGGGVDLINQTLIEGKSLSEVDWGSVGAAAAGGAVSGVIASTGIGTAVLTAGGMSGGAAAIGGGMLTGALSGASGSAVDTVVYNLSHNIPATKNLVKNTAIGTITGVVAGGVSSFGSLLTRGTRAAIGAMKGGENIASALNKAFARKAQQQIEAELIKKENTIASYRLVRSTFKATSYGNNPIKAAAKVIQRTGLKELEKQNIQDIVKNIPKDFLKDITISAILKYGSKRKGFIGAETR